MTEFVQSMLIGFIVSFMVTLPIAMVMVRK